MEWTDKAPTEEGGWYVCVGHADDWLYNISAYGYIVKYGRSLYFSTGGTNYLLTRIKGQWFGPLPMRPLKLNKEAR